MYGLFFIVYIILIMLLIIYFIVFIFYNKKIRATISENLTTETSLYPLNTNDIRRRKDCGSSQIYCSTDNDCKQICSHAIDDTLLSEYKCSDIKTCTQSILTGENNDTSIVKCIKEFGFMPVLTADELFQSHWICLNTLPHIFNNQQNYHPYICSGGKIDRLVPQHLFDTCICNGKDIKVRDEFRSDIPICLNPEQLPLFPNFYRA